MKSASAGLNTHLQGEVTTLATCWKVKRTDGVTFHFTEHDADLQVDVGDGDGAQTYLANSSYNRSAIRNNDTLAVDNLDLTGVLDSTAVDETELRRGLFDFAEVFIFIVNWADLSQGILRMRRGWLGEVTITPNGFFQAELRGLTQAFSRNIGMLYSPECRADLGDSRCKVPILPEVAVRNKAYAVGDAVRAASELETVPASRVLVHGENGAEDVGDYGGTPILGTQVSFSTAVTKFGPASIEFSPSGSADPSQAFVAYADDPLLTIGASKFTIRGWVRFKDLTSTVQVFASHYSNVSDQRSWYVARNGGNIEFFASDDGTAVAPALTISGVFTPGWAVDTWYHFEVTRDASNDVRMFVDGVQYGATTAVAFALHNSSDSLRLGKYRSSGFGDNPLNGFLEDFNLVVGAALHTAGFTPPGRLVTIAETVATLLCPQFDDRIYVCTTAGTTDVAIQPAYDTTVSNTTADGSAVFTAEQAWSRCITVSAVDGVDPRKKFTVTQLTPNSGGSVPGRDHFPDDSINGGVVVWETGANAGRAMEVRDFVADDGITITQDLELFLDLPFDVQVGDTARVYRGCLKRLLPDCRDVFDNVVNFRGEPFVPGQDLLYSYPDAKA